MEKNINSGDDAILPIFSIGNIGFTCMICSETQTLNLLESYQKRIPICDKCIECLKEIILEKRKLN